MRMGFRQSPHQSLSSCREPSSKSVAQGKSPQRGLQKHSRRSRSLIGDSWPQSTVLVVQGLFGSGGVCQMIVGVFTELCGYCAGFRKREAGFVEGASDVHCRILVVGFVAHATLCIRSMHLDIIVKCNRLCKPCKP